MKLTFDITKSYLDFRLDVRGEFDLGIVGIFGESGSGKSTFLHCLSGLVRPDEAEIFYDGKPLFSSSRQHNMPIQDRHIGIVLQDALLFPHLSVEANIFYHLDGKHASFARELIKLLNITPLLSRDPATLSGGERQRVALARTLARRPELLLMDEPISSLDLKARGEIISYLQHIYREYQIPIIYVSHSISELMALSQSISRFYNGRIVSYASADQVFSDLGIDEHFDPFGVENIFHLPVAHTVQNENYVVLDFFGQKLQVAYSGPPVPALDVGIKANDIIVAAKPVTGLSARNLIDGRIKKVIKRKGAFILYVDVNGHNCFVELTPGAFYDLGLSEKQKVYLIIKSRSIIVLR